MDESTAQKVFVGVRISASSTVAVLRAIQELVGPVKAAKRDAAEARLNGEWDVVNDVELEVADEVIRMTVTEFAQYMSDARYRGSRTRQTITGPSRH